MTDASQETRDKSAMRSLRESLERLAAAPDRQAEYLRQIGMASCADELALEFDDVELMIPGLVERGFLSADEATSLRTLGDALRAMSGEANADLWTTTALHEANEWREVRDLAEACLFRLGFLEG